jgi:hypothetical protein
MTRWARALGTVLIVGFLAVILGRLTINEVVLDLRHRVTDATVTRVELRRSVDFADVTFLDATGKARRARIQLSWWPGDVTVGDSQRIDYDPSHPSRARRHGAHDPLALWPLAAALCLAAFLGFGNRRRRTDRPPRRVVLNPSE